MDFEDGTVREHLSAAFYDHADVCYACRRANPYCRIGHYITRALETIEANEANLPNPVEITPNP